MSLVDQWLKTQGINTLTTETDELSQVDKWLMEQEANRIKKMEEENLLLEQNRIKEQEKLQAEIESSRVNVDKLPFEQVKKYIAEEESKGDPEAIFINKNGTEDIGTYQINERWLNKNPTEEGLMPYATLADGNPDTTYMKIHDQMRTSFPQWDTLDDKGRRLLAKVPEINEAIALILHEDQGLKPWATRDKVIKRVQSDYTSGKIDNLVSDALNGNTPELNNIFQTINLDSNIEGYQEMKDEYGPEAADKWAARQTSILGREKTEEEHRRERIFEAERPKGFFDAIGKYANDPVKLVPFINASSDIKQIARITGMMSRIDQATKDGVEPDREDMLDLYEWQLNNRSEKSWGYLVGSILGELPAFALELGMTSGVYTAGKSATIKAGNWALKKALSKEMRDKTAKWLTKHNYIKGTADFSGKAVSNLMGATVQGVAIEGIGYGLYHLPGDWAQGGRIRQGFLDRMMGNLPITENERGELEAGIFTEGDDFKEAFAKSATDYWIELFSERSGGSFKMLSSLGARGREAAMKYAWIKKMLELNPKKSLKQVNEFKNRIGWHGILGEFGEERVGEVARGIAWELGMDDEGFQWKRPTLKQWSAELVGFAAGGAGISLAGARPRSAIIDPGKIDPGQIVPEFNRNDPESIKNAIKANGFTVTKNERDGKWEVITKIGDTIIGHKEVNTEEQANDIAEIWEEELTHFSNAKEVEFIGGRPPVMETETDKQDKRPWFQKEAEEGRKIVKAAEDLGEAVPTSEQITKNLEQVYGETEVTGDVDQKVDDPVVDKKDYNKMLVKDLKAELKNRNLSRAGKKADLVARLQEADKEAPTTEVKPIKVFHGESIDGKPRVTEKNISPPPNKTLVINKDQVDIIQDLQKQNIPGSEKFTINKQGKISDYKAADSFIRDHYKDQYDYIQYNNQQMPAKGTEYHSLKDDKFYSPNKDLANIYAMTGKARKQAAKKQKKDTTYKLTPQSMAEAFYEDWQDPWTVARLKKEIKDRAKKHPDYKFSTKGKRADLITQLATHDIHLDKKRYTEGKKQAEAKKQKKAQALKNQDLDTRINTELTKDESSQFYLDDIRSSKTDKPLAFLSKIKTNSINGFKKAAKELQNYIDTNDGSANDVVSNNVYEAQKAIEGMETILQGRNLEFDDNYDIIDLGVDEVTTVKKAPADTRTQEEIEAENLELMEEMGLTDTDKKTGEAIQPQGLSQTEKDEIDDVDDISDIDAKEQQAIERIEKSIGVKKFFDNTDPNYKLADKMADAAIIGAGIIRRGAKNFKQFSSEMVKKIGKGVKPYLKKLYNNAKAYVKEYIKNPKIGAMIQDVSKLDPSILFEPVPVSFYKNKQGKISINTKTLTGKNQAQAAKIYNWMWEFGTNKADFVKAWSKAANEKQRGGLSRRQYEIQVLEKLHPIAKANFIKDVKSRYNKAQDKFGLLQTFESGKHVMDWYDNFYDYMVKNFGDEAGLAIDFIAITSAGVDLHSNIGYGLKAYAQYKVNDKLDTGLYPATLIGNLQNAIDNHRNRNNPNYKPKKIGGMKVTNFSQALRKDENAVVLDLWMAREFGLWQVATPNNVKATKPNPKNPEKDIKGTSVWIYDKKGNGFKATVVGVGKRKAEVEWGGGRGKPKNRKSFSYKEMAIIKDKFEDREYIQYEQVIKELAEKRGVTPRQMQAGIWFGIREGHSPMHPGQPHLESAYFEDLLTARMNGHINKKGEKIPPWTYKGYNVNQLKELSPDISDALNSFSSFPSPAQMDLVKTMLIDAGRFTYDQLSPAMQKLGNKLGINNNNFKMRFTQYANNARNMTESSKKWFKKVMNHMKTWFKRNAKKLIDSKPVQKAYQRLENMVTLKAVPDGIDILSNIEKRVEEKVNTSKQDDKYYDEIGSIGSQDKIEKEESGGFISTWLLSLSDRLKDIKGGIGILRLLRKYEAHTLNTAKDVKAAEPMFKFLKRLKKKSKKDFAKLEFALFTGNKAQIDKILDKYQGKMRYGDVKKAYKDMRGVLDSIYYRAMGLEKEEKLEYDTLERDIVENAANVPNNNWSVKKIKKWMQDNNVKFTSKDRKADLLKTISKIKGMKGKMESLEKNIKRFNELDKKVIYKFPFWGDGDITIEYFPRNTIDYYKLREFLKGKMKSVNKEHLEGQLDKMLDDLAKKHNLASKDLLSDEVAARAITSWLKSSGAKQRPAKPGSSKGRIIDMLNLTPKEAAKLMSFYQDPSSSLMTYIYEMNEATARQQLFGKGVDINIGENHNHLAAYINGLVMGENAQGIKIDAKDQQEISDIFRARFSNNWGKYASTLQRIKNLTYMTTIADIWSTLMQTGDIFDAAYRSGDPVTFLQALTQSAIPGLSPTISAKKEGFVRISAEYSNDAESFAKALNAMFKYSGFSTLDRIGKETLVNATIIRITKEIKAGKLSTKSQMLIENAFGERAESFIESVKKDEVSAELEEQRHADLVELAYWTLLEHQPVAESEMPAKYLESPEIRMGYQLKTWAMKKISFWRSETKSLWRRGNKVEAVKQGVFIASLMVLAGASPDIIRDILRGRPVHLKDSDLWVDTLLRLFGISKFGVMKAWRRSEWGTFASGFVPSLGLLDAATHDSKYLYKWLKWHNNPRKEDRPSMLDPRYGLKFINQVPQIGKTIYNGLPNPFVPRDAEGFLETVSALPDQDDGYITYLQGWRGRYQTVKRQEDYYNDLEEWGREQKPRRRLTEFERNQRRLARNTRRDMEREQDRNGRDLHRWLEKAEKRFIKESEEWMEKMERAVKP